MLSKKGNALMGEFLDHVNAEHDGEPKFLCAACLQYRAEIASS